MKSDAGSRLMESIDAENEIYLKTIETKRVDETGAQKEVFFHKKVNEIIKDKIEFDNEGKAKLSNPDDNAYLISVCSRDLKRANKEGGHFGGDILLQNTVNATAELLKNANITKNDIFHLHSSDFIAVCSCDEKQADTVLEQSITKSVQFGNNAKAGKLTVSYVSIKEVVDFYNSYVEMLNLPKDRNPKQSTKVFTGNALQLLSFRQEQQKLADIYTDLNEIKLSGKDPEEAFLLFAAPLFRRQNINSYKELESVSDHEALFFKEAFERTYGNGDLPIHIWKLLENKLEEFKQISRIYTDENLEEYIELEKETTAEKSLSIDEINKAFTIEKFIFKTYKGTRLNFLMENLQELPELFDANVTGNQSERLVEIISALSELVPDNIETNKRWNEIQKGVRESYARIHEVAYRKTQGETRAEDWVEDMHIVRLNKLKQLANTTLEGIRLEIDTHTGLKNKETFIHDIQESLINDDTNVGVIFLDMGFLQYFNNIGERKVGDLAISKAAYILGKVTETMKESKVLAEAYRTGGDEFALIVHGNEDQTRNAYKAIYEINQDIEPVTKKPNGLVPKSSGCKDTYVPKMLRFDGNILHGTHGKQILSDILSLEEYKNPFSSEDTKTLKKALNGETINNEEKELYKGILAQIMERTGDKIIEDNKKPTRFKLLLNTYLENLDTEVSKETIEQRQKQFTDFLAFSGKSMNGKTIKNFENTIKYAKEQNMDYYELSDNDYDKLTKYFYSTETVTELVSPLEDLVELFNERGRKKI